MAKKAISALAAGVAVFSGIAATPAQAADDIKVADARVSAESQTPVPGGMTVGRVNIGNSLSATEVLPAGTTFIVKFDRVQGKLSTGVATLTTWYSGHVGIKQIDRETFRVTLTRDFTPGMSVPLDWSKAHWFDYSTRDKITVSLEQVPMGVTEVNADNNTATYDNNGRGF